MGHSPWQGHWPCPGRILCCDSGRTQRISQGCTQGVAVLKVIPRRAAWRQLHLPPPLFPLPRPPSCPSLCSKAFPAFFPSTLPSFSLPFCSFSPGSFVLLAVYWGCHGDCQSIPASHSSGPVAMARGRAPSCPSWGHLPPPPRGGIPWGHPCGTSWPLGRGGDPQQLRVGLAAWHSFTAARNTAIKPSINISLTSKH